MEKIAIRMQTNKDIEVLQNLTGKPVTLEDNGELYTVRLDDITIARCETKEALAYMLERYCLVAALSTRKALEVVWDGNPIK